MQSTFNLNQNQFENVSSSEASISETNVSATKTSGFKVILV